VKSDDCLFLRYTELRGFLGVLLVLSCLPLSADAQQNLSADWVETLLAPSQTLRNYRGGVVYEDSVRSLVVKSDSAHVRVGDAIYLFVHKVNFRDSVREIRADTLVFYEGKGQAAFRGSVFMRDGDQSVAAREVSFFYDTELLRAQGNVALQLPGGRSLSADGLYYNLPLKQGNVFGQTHLEVVGEWGDTLHATADSISFRNEGKSLRLLDRVRFWQKRVLAEATLASYTDSIALLTGAPAITWKNEKDSIFAQAQEIGIHLHRHILSSVTFADSTAVFTSAIRDSTRNANTIYADSAEIVFAGKVPERLSAWGNVKLRLSEQDSFCARLSGRYLKMAYLDGEPDSLLLTGPSIGSYVSRDGLSQSRLGGHDSILWFRSGKLLQLEIYDEAYCTRSTQERDDVTVSGDALRLDFNDGNLTRIEARGAVQGRYRVDTEDVP